MRRDLVTLNKVLEEDIKFEGDIPEITYDPETQEVIYEGSEKGFKDLYHTTKNIDIFE
ncbi:MAG: hypothetical protein ACOCP4_01595 [Candidatus Woesearchaeota archaeon]